MNLYTNLITSAVGLTEKTLAALAEAGLDHVQISIQDADAASADRIAGYDGAYVRKRALAREVVHLGIPLTINAVIHRANIDRVAAMVDQAVALGASRVEIAHVQYYGLGPRKPRKADADQTAGRARGWLCRGSARTLPWHHRHRRRPTGLFRTLPQTLHGMGAPIAQRLTVRQGSALPCN